MDRADYIGSQEVPRQNRSPLPETRLAGCRSTVRLGLQREWLGYAADARALGIVPGSRATRKLTGTKPTSED